DPYNDPGLLGGAVSGPPGRGLGHRPEVPEVKRRAGHRVGWRRDAKQREVERDGACGCRFETVTWQRDCLITGQDRLRQAREHGESEAEACNRRANPKHRIILLDGPGGWSRCYSGVDRRCVPQGTAEGKSCARSGYAASTTYSVLPTSVTNRAPARLQHVS